MFVIRLLSVIPCLLFIVACGGGNSSPSAQNPDIIPAPTPSPTANTAPTVGDVSIFDDNGGAAIVGDRLTGNYTWQDADNNLEGASVYRWLRNGNEIHNATSPFYIVTIHDRSQKISFEVTPVATQGVVTGNTVASTSILIAAATARVSTLANTGFGAGSGMVVTPMGDLLVSGGLNAPSIVHITRNGQVSDFGTVELDSPMGMDYDSEGNLFVANYSTNTIHKITPGGTMTEFASGLDGPMGLVINSSNEVFVTLYGENLSGMGGTVLKFQPSGSMEVLAAGGGMQDLIGIALDENENIYVANSTGGSVFEVVNGTVSTYAQLPESIIHQIAYVNGYLYLPSSAPSVLYKINNAGEVEVYAGTSTDTIINGDINEANFSAPNSIAITDNGSHLYVLDSGGEVRVISPTVQIASLANTNFEAGRGMVVTTAGDLLISGGVNAPSIVRVTPQGQVSDFEAAGLDSPMGMDYDSQGNLFVVNYSSNTVHKIMPNGDMTEFASGLDGPMGLIVNSNNEVFVTLYGDNLSGEGGTVLKFQPNGSMEVLATGNGMKDLIGITLDADENIIVANSTGGAVFKIANGIVLVHAQLPESVIHQIAYANDYIYLPSSTPSVLYKVNKRGEVETFAGTSTNAIINGNINEADFAAPNSIAVTDDGSHLYVLDKGGEVRIITGIAPLEISKQAVGGVFWEESEITLSVAARGEGELTYMWYKGDANEVIGVEPTLSHIIQHDEAIPYWVVVSDDIGSVRSENINIEAKFLPEIVQQPIGISFFPGETGTLSVVANGINLSYEWTHGDHRQGRNSPTVSFTLGGTYFVKVTSVLSNGERHSIFSNRVNVDFNKR